MHEKEKWETPYAHAGGLHSLSGQALSDVAREVLARGHSFRFLAKGTSMIPLIRNGDIITLVPYSCSSSPGSVVAFIHPKHGRLVVHRVVAIFGDSCRIRGDNCHEDDGDVLQDSIIGTVSNIERAGKSVRFGLGPERVLIAQFSRRNWLSPCVVAAGTVLSAIRRRS